MTPARNAADIAVQGQRLAAVTTALAELRARYDVLMNAFKFEEARAVHARIEAAEEEQRELTSKLPAPPDAAPTPYRVAGRRRRR